MMSLRSVKFLKLSKRSTPLLLAIFISVLSPTIALADSQGRDEPVIGSSYSMQTLDLMSANEIKALVGSSDVSPNDKVKMMMVLMSKTFSPNREPSSIASINTDNAVKAERHSAKLSRGPALVGPVDSAGN